MRRTSFFVRVRTYLKITRASGIVRRYFIMNGFDGTMTVLGIVLGSWLAGVAKPEIIVLAGLGTCLAMALSGFSGAYLAERAERERHLKNLEEKTNNHVAPIQYEASRFIEFYVALIDALSPVLTTIITLAPFFFVFQGFISLGNAYLYSVALSLTTLFLFGIYLGKIAKDNGLLYGLIMLMVGMLTAAIILLSQLFLLI